MTTKEYAAYCTAFLRGMRRLGVNNVSTKYRPDGDSVEAHFSWRPCEVCGTTLGGNREDCDGYNPKTREVVEFEACIDCVYFHAYGQLPDGDMPER